MRWYVICTGTAEVEFKSKVVADRLSFFTPEYVSLIAALSVSPPHGESRLILLPSLKPNRPGILVELWPKFNVHCIICKALKYPLGGTAWRSYAYIWYQELHCRALLDAFEVRIQNERPAPDYLFRLYHFF